MWTEEKIPALSEESMICVMAGNIFTETLEQTKDGNAVYTQCSGADLKFISQFLLQDENWRIAWMFHVFTVK